MGVLYVERAGHCTRCWTPFGDNPTAYMIWLRTAAEIFQNGFATHQDKYAPVCDACVTPKKQAEATRLAICKGCGQRMALTPNSFIKTCSNRCEQRNRRARKRAAAKATCATFRKESSSQDSRRMVSGWQDAPMPRLA